MLRPNPETLVLEGFAEMKAARVALDALMADGGPISEATSDIAREVLAGPLNPYGDWQAGAVLCDAASDITTLSLLRLSSVPSPWGDEANLMFAEAELRETRNDVVIRFPGKSEFYVQGAFPFEETSVPA